MVRSLALTFGLVLVVPAARSMEVSGKVRNAAGEPVPGVFVTAHDESRGIRVSVTTAEDGSYRLRVPDAEAVTVTAHGIGFGATEPRALTAGDSDVDLTAARSDDRTFQLPASVFIGLLPEGAEKRRFIVDCMGCHPLNQKVMWDAEGRFLDQADWQASTEKMLSFSGHTTAFPILPPDRAPEPTAEFVGPHLTEERVSAAVRAAPEFRAPTRPYEVTEYDLPEQRDFPHDLMLDSRGRVLVTGMFSGLMYVLDPATGAFDALPIPTEQANPRALDVDERGDWWILCGMAHQIAHYSVEEEAWTMHDIGMYGHSIAVDSRRRAWFNGHFTNAPIEMGWVDGKTGAVHTLEVPAIDTPPEQGGPIPYGLRVAPDGTVWSTELAGNRLIEHDPESGETRAYEMPSPHSGPRRLDVAPDGSVWIPEFSAGKLARFDPETRTFEEHDFPTKDSLPYCARVDAERGLLWVSQCGNDAIARVNLETREIVEFRLPVTTAFIRHLDVDPETGDVWAAYSHSPGIHPRIVRLRMLAN